MPTVRELVTRLGFDADTTQAKRYDQTLADVRRTAVGAAAAVTALAAGTVALAKRMAASGNEIAKSAVEAGLAAGEFQRLTFAIGQVTRLSGAQAQQALMRLNDTIGRARIEGGRYAESLEMLGFTQAEIASGSIDNAEAFARVTEAIGKTANAQDAAALASRVLGERVGRQLGPALRENAGAMAALQERSDALGVGWSDLALKEAELLTDAFAEVGVITTTLTSTIAESLLPAVRAGIEAFTDWWVINRDLVQQNVRRWMEGLATGARLVQSVVGRMIRVIDDVVQAIGGWERTIRLTSIALSMLVALRVARWVWGVTRAIQAAVAATGLLRLGLIALQRVGILALFAALSLAIEDLIVWMQGGNSVLGEWLGTWDDFRVKAKDAIDSVIRDLDPFIRQIQAVGTILAGALTLDKDRVLAGFRDLGQAMIDYARQLGVGLRDAILGVLPDWMVRALEGAGGAISASVEGVSNAAGQVGDFMTGGARDPGADVQAFGRNRRIEVNARTEATLQVPQGTPDEQRRVIERQTEEIFSEHWDREMRRALWDFQPVE